MLKNVITSLSDIVSQYKRGQKKQNNNYGNLKKQINFTRLLKNTLNFKTVQVFWEVITILVIKDYANLKA